MKKNGFTLIELLAVIVILAIISLIAVPIVLNIIEESKESLTKRGAEYYFRAIDIAVSKNRLDKIKLEGTYNILSNGNICNQNDITNEVCNDGKEITIDVTGETPNSGIVKIEQNEVVYLKAIYDEITVILPKPVSFKKDSWEVIIENIKAGNTDAYNVGDTKEIALEGYTNKEDGSNGLYTVRLANKTTNDEENVCTNSNYSQTACGFVIEFVDVITIHKMNSTETNEGGWPASEMREFVTPVEGVEGSGTIYNALPEEVKTAIIDTRVVSGHGENDDSNKVSTDKLYLLSEKEVWGDSSLLDTAKDETRQLDYYRDNSGNNSVLGRNLDGAPSIWWLRSAYFDSTSAFCPVMASSIIINSNGATKEYGVVPAFRLG